MYYCSVLRVSILELIENAPAVKHHGANLLSTDQTSVSHKERVKNA